MATQKQIAANTANSKLSTGPKTLTGRSRSSQNSLKHGIRAQKIMLLAGEEEWVDAADEYLAHFRPVGAYQHGLVMQMIQCQLALDRSHRVEADLLTSGCLGKDLVALQYAGPIDSCDNAAHETPAASAEPAEISSVIKTQATNAEAVAQGDVGPPATVSLFELVNVNDTERAELTILRENFAQNGQMLELLRRYRTSQENSFYRALHALQRDQGLDGRENAATPATLPAPIQTGLPSIPI